MLRIIKEEVKTEEFEFHSTKILARTKFFHSPISLTEIYTRDDNIEMIHIVRPGFTTHFVDERNQLKCSSSNLVTKIFEPNVSNNNTKTYKYRRNESNNTIGQDKILAKLAEKSHNTKLAQELYDRYCIRSTPITITVGVLNSWNLIKKLTILENFKQKNILYISFKVLQCYMVPHWMIYYLKHKIL